MRNKRGYELRYTSCVSFFFAMILRPFVALIVLGLICLPIRLLVMKAPDSKLKRALLSPVSLRAPYKRRRK
jgi:hypothetical protein